jgi:hypothetical protein
MKHGDAEARRGILIKGGVGEVVVLPDLAN